MNKIQNAKLNSYNVLQGVVAKESVILGTLPEFELRNEAFNNAVAAIQVVTPQQVYANSAEMDRYKSIRGLLAKQCARLSKKLVLYADTTANDSLRKDVKYTLYEWQRMKKSKFFDLVNLLVERATKVLPSATVAQLTQQDIDDVVQTLAILIKTKDALRNQQLKKRNDSRTIAEVFATADLALEKLFLTLVLLTDTHPLLYKKLMEASKLIYGYKSLSVRGVVAETKTEYPIKGVKLVIRKIGDSAPADLMIETPDVEKVSTGIGGFVLKSLPQGTYLLTATKLGYNTTNIQFNVDPSETTIVNVLMSVA